MLKLLIGGYSDANALALYDFDATTGKSSLLHKFPVANASFAAISPKGVIYVVTESDTERSLISAFRIDGGQLLSQCKVEGNSPCYVAISPDGSWVATANYGDGTVSVFDVLADSSLSPLVNQIKLQGRGPVERRQACSRAHCIAFSRDGRFMFVTNLGADRIVTFRIVSSTKLTPVSEVSLEPGSGPRHLIFNTEGTKAYVINEISDAVTVFNHNDGILTPIQYISADTYEAHGAGDIIMSADGSKVYASLRLRHDGMATFNVKSDGRLVHAGHTDTGGHPRCLTLSADGQFLYAACRDANAVEVYKIDGNSLTHIVPIPHERAVFVREI